MEMPQIFENKEFGKVRVTEYNGAPWFVASDVAKALGYERPADAVNIHCKKANKITQYCDSPDRVKTPPINLNIIPESDVYRLVMRSNLPGAERFQDWVVEEVLPAIRKTGGYGTPQTENEILSRAITIAANRLYRDLRKDGYLIRRKGANWNMPKQRMMDKGYFRVVERSTDTEDDYQFVTVTTMLTGMGQYHLFAHFLNKYGVRRQLSLFEGRARA